MPVDLFPRLALLWSRYGRCRLPAVRHSATDGLPLLVNQNLSGEVALPLYGSKDDAKLCIKYLRRIKS